MAAFHPFLPLDRGQFLADLLRDLPGEDGPVRLACAGPAMRPFSTRETEARLSVLVAERCVDRQRSGRLVELEYVSVIAFSSRGNHDPPPAGPLVSAFDPVRGNSVRLIQPSYPAAFAPWKRDLQG
jgi:hypothetical protein